ncbi:Gibberellin-regulated protein 10 [Sesamum angolense]|uniref:Gibberellin-regulated protein 10 n=1 Tax=Sesamum angolense TaxID=2727404 RepID=A0AAE2BMT7_9LAMI|nr:Gibberellin-regulated protein 10 [Sesamum angolense]
MKLLTMATVLLTLLLLTTMLEMTTADQDPPSDLSAFCKGNCDVRCSLASRKDRCLKYCGICCTKCNCVPPGTSGNKDECPCYRDLKNSKGESKCP